MSARARVCPSVFLCLSVLRVMGMRRQACMSVHVHSVSDVFIPRLSSCMYAFARARMRACVCV